MATFSQVFSEPAKADAQAGETGSEYQPIDGGDPVDPADRDDGDGGPPPEIASEYHPIGGDPVDPGDPVA